MKNLGKIVATGVVVVILVLAIVGSVVTLSGQTTAREKGLWSDATDVLSNTAALGAGRESRAPLINTEQGNMLIFFFALGGVVAGFTIGYNWRRVIAEKS